jgi:hypothetical protein
MTRVFPAFEYRGVRSETAAPDEVETRMGRYPGLYESLEAFNARELIFASAYLATWLGPSLINH